MIFAHRGLCQRAPENTLAAFRLAHEAGCRWIELDVDILADGTPVILHDSTLDRTTNRSGSMYRITRDDLKEIDAGAWFSPEHAGEPIPTLAQVVEFLNETGLNCNIELKANEAGAASSLTLVNNTLRDVEKLDPGCEIILSSFSPLLLAEAHRRAPNYAIGVLFEQATIRRDWRSVLELCGASYIHLEDHALATQQISLARSAGFEVNVWTVNSRARANELLHAGVSGIFTDRADEMLDLARAEQPRSDGQAT